MTDRHAILSSRAYRYYVLALLFAAYVLNVVDRSPVLGVSLQAIKRDFGVSDTALGLLSGVAFAVFYSTLGIPIAAWADRSSRRNILTAAIAVWSAMTALSGLAATFPLLFAARVGTAVGEAGGSPPSHSLISDYFPRRERGTAFSILALGVGVGTAVGSFVAGRAIGAYGWRTTFMLVGLPGLAVALLVRLTVVEPPRDFSERAPRPAVARRTPSMAGAVRVLWRKRSFRHVSLGAALHSVVWYASGAFNAAFLQRSHQMTAGAAANWLSVFAVASIAGTLAGGTLTDGLSARRGDPRWYFWIPGAATLLMVPVQIAAYLAVSWSVAMPLFIVMAFLAAMFFGPSFAMAQALATTETRSVATSVLLFVQTIIGYGLGPLAAGYLSDRLAPAFGINSLRYALLLVGVVNVWAAAHYAAGARTLRADLADSASGIRRQDESVA